MPVHTSGSPFRPPQRRSGWDREAAPRNSFRMGQKTSLSVLDPVHGFVGAPEQTFSRASMPRRESQADARRNDGLPAPGHPHLFRDPGDKGLRVGLIPDVLEQDDEFVPPTWPRCRTPSPTGGGSGRFLPGLCPPRHAPGRRWIRLKLWRSTMAAASSPAVSPAFARADSSRSRRQRRFGRFVRGSWFAL